LPGLIKVSGAQRTIAAPYVKVSGTWRNVAVAYTKVDGDWRQWYAAQITDSFDRTDASSLGTVSNGVTSWTDVTGSWGISSNKAATATAASSYPLSKVQNPLLQSNYELKIDVPSGAGAGVGFWITDTNNWYAAVTHTTRNNVYTCGSGYTFNAATTKCEKTSTYNATLNCTARTYNSGSSGGYSYAGAATQSEEYIHGAPGCVSCSYSCDSAHCYRQVFTCPAGQTKINNDCYTYSAPTAGSCSSGGPVPACGSGQCYTTSYSCTSGDTLNGTTCTNFSSVDPDVSYTYTHAVKVLRKASGTVTELASTNVGTTVSDVATNRLGSLKVVTSNTTIDITAYTGAGQTGTATTITSYVASSPTTTANAGIIIAPSGYGQASAVDNFNLK
jgi:hypothetical protein